MENTNEPKNLVIAQQGGTALAAAATLALAVYRIVKLVKGDTTAETAE